jgi:hypothetical protein
LSWLKLGEVAVNPFGDDDDDFDIVSLLENHFQVYQLNDIRSIYYCDDINFVKQVSSDLLNLFELNLGNPTAQSMEMTSLTLVLVLYYWM